MFKPAKIYTGISHVVLAVFVAFHGRLSPESIYFRFFSPKPRLSANLRKLKDKLVLAFRDARHAERCWFAERSRHSPEPHLVRRWWSCQPP